jgi:uncharacterized oligopeptide transporter (OPT) family protein
VTTNVLKTGYLLGAPVAGQVRAQMLGAVVGLLVSIPAYSLMKNLYGIGTERLPAPGALPWKALAELAESGAAALPPGAGLACLWAAGIGVLLSLLERTRAARFIPSPMALAVAFMIPATISGAIALGSVVWLVLYRRPPADAERIASSTAAGGIAGESIMVLVVAVLTALGAF